MDWFSNALCIGNGDTVILGISEMEMIEKPGFRKKNYRRLWIPST